MRKWIAADGRARSRAALLGPALTAMLVLASCGGRAAPPYVGVVSIQQVPPTDPPTPAATPTPPPPPTAAPVRAYAPVSGGTYHPAPPRYPLVDRFDAPSVGVHLPVVAVGIVRGAMEAPEGPLGSAFWHEGFWLREGVVPGMPGVATIAGHLDDTAGRPAAFWNIRNLRTGDEVTVTRLSDGAVLRFRIVETDVWTLATANTAANIHRIYGDGTAGDGVSRLTLITCTGRWVNGEYDHRFVAFAELET